MFRLSKTRSAAVVRVVLDEGGRLEEGFGQELADAERKSIVMRVKLPACGFGLLLRAAGCSNRAPGGSRAGSTGRAAGPPI